MLPLIKVSFQGGKEQFKVKLSAPIAGKYWIILHNCLKLWILAHAPPVSCHILW
jgi:hypothetical protein